MKNYSIDSLIGENAYSIMGYVRRALNETGHQRLIDGYLQKAMSGSYSNLIEVSKEQLNLINEETK